MSTLPEKMKAVVAYEPGDYRLAEVSVPRAGEGEMVVKVEACGVCAGDLKAYHGAPSFWGGEGNPAYIKAPMIPGHEFIGHIVELGPNAPKGFKIGDRVISEQIVPCGECKFCKSGRHWMCQKHDVYGFQNNVNGGMAEYMKFPKEALVFKVPDSIPMESAVLIEPYACSKHAVDRANITNEDVVVLSGAGTLGLGMVGAIAMKNPKKLIVLDLKKDRLDKALEFGADLAFNPREIDVVEEVVKMTEGYGCDIYIEASGHPASVSQGLEMIRKMGTYVEFSVFKDLVTVDWSIISDRKELDVLGAHLSPYCYEPVIEWMEKKMIPTEGVVTHILPLTEWEKAFEMADKGDNSLKIVLQP